MNKIVDSELGLALKAAIFFLLKADKWAKR